MFSDKVYNGTCCFFDCRYATGVFNGLFWVLYDRRTKDEEILFHMFIYTAFKYVHVFTNQFYTKALNVLVLVLVPRSEAWLSSIPSIRLCVN